ncbi:MAG: SGNH/GDSL hydrolase family protein [Clostridia bacterium]|nr:SGNH/GDSL hydrolase family protein [Clostridia bacterium]
MKKTIALLSALLLLALPLVSCAGEAADTTPAATTTEAPATTTAATTEAPEPQPPFPLDGKTFVFLGSSVTYGSASGGWSMADYIAEEFDCTVVKWAVSGTTLVTSNANSYVARMENEMRRQKVCDHLIVQLSTNDASQNKPLGTISDSMNKEDFDTTTVIGAIEYIIASAKEKWNCEVSFYTGTKYDSTAYFNMVNALLEIQEKWGIGVIDLYNDPEMNAVSDRDYSRYMSDPIHPNKVGYMLWWGPKFAEHLQQYQ